jgi:hypothetical protein
MTTKNRASGKDRKTLNFKKLTTKNVCFQKNWLGWLPRESEHSREKNEQSRKIT